MFLFVLIYLKKKLMLLQLIYIRTYMYMLTLRALTHPYKVIRVGCVCLNFLSNQFMIYCFISKTISNFFLCLTNG